ncbi:MAG: hypothetical protein MRERV_12c003 [Mycoplasmataceae bacterium RV_VA103A]|nr:MAG: hypothetical protein MRERV_12c003 [Mycoplasmataceae bacterium RV_VA103A]
MQNYKNMPKTLINLIKKSNLIIIYGHLGTGKSLLLTKLANHPDFQGNIYQGNFSLDDVSVQGNIFIDDLDLVPFALPSPDSLENQKQLRQWSGFLTKTRQNQQKIFLTVGNIKDLWIGVRELVDLIVEVQGIKEDHLSFQVKQNEKWQIITDDWTNLEQLKLKRMEKVF